MPELAQAVEGTVFHKKDLGQLLGSDRTNPVAECQAPIMKLMRKSKFTTY
jgi:hypothetical protein